MKHSKYATYILLVSTIVVSCLFSSQVPAQQSNSDALAAMQKVIDQQRAELNTQSQQLETQQQRLDDQQKLLDSLQTQLQALAREQGGQETVVEPPAEVHLSKAEDSDSVDTPADQPVDSAPASTSRPVALSSQPVRFSSTWKPIHADHLALDTRPLDVPDDTGIFIYSKDHTKMFRIFGSIRALAIYDNRQNFHPYDLNIPQVPVGEDDVKDWNQDWTINTTKLGFQGALKDYFTVFGEFDWKGESGDALRIRHMYMRNRNWLVGKHWTAFNTLKFLPLSIDSHSTSAHLGVRPVQIKYLGGSELWNLQLAVDNYQPKFEEPVWLDASARNIMPNLVGNVSYVRPWGMIRVAGMLSANKVRYSVEDQPRTSSSDVGLGLLAGLRADLNEKFTIKTHIQRTAGNNQYNADYAYERNDMGFNPQTGEFENLKGWGGQLALEHHWTPTLTSSIGAGYMSMDTKSYQPGDTFDHGYKALVNLFYRPAAWLKGVTLAGEVEFAGQTTRDGSSGDTTRFSVLLYYDF